MSEIILYIGGFQALFFLVFLAVVRLHTTFEKIIFAWLIEVFIFLLSILLVQNTSGLAHNYFIYLCFSLTVTNGPFFYLCVESFTTRKIKLSFKHIICFSNFFILLLLPAIFDLNQLLKPETIELLSVFNVIIYAAFVFLSAFKLKKYQKCAKDQFSNSGKFSLKWMYLLLYGELFFLAFSIAIGITGKFIQPHSVTFDSQLEVFPIVTLIVINFLGFVGIKQNMTFNKNDFFSLEEKEEEIERIDTYTNYGLKSEEAADLAEKLTTYMEEEYPYKNMDLSLKDLADALDTYPHYITQVLSTIINKNFYDFVNSYRIEEIKRRLEDPKSDKFTILGIAYECGFNSKTTFNRIFKQKTGVTPSEYKRTLLVEKE